MYSLTLSSGKKIAFEEYGDPEGKPIFLFHGWPGSRLQGKRLHQLAQSFHVRLICPDRPGFGQSDFDPCRKLLNYPHDIAQLADHLHLTKFSVMGVSGGGPYAAACAYALPKRVLKAGIVVGLSPTNLVGVLQGMAPLNKATWYLYHYIPGLIYSSSFLQYIRKWVFPISARGSLASTADKQLMDSKLSTLIAENRTESFRQGIRGAAHDVKIFVQPWGFDVCEIEVPVFLWYGALDKNVSVKMGEYYATQIKDSKLTIYPDAGHLVIDMYGREILKSLT